MKHFGGSILILGHFMLILFCRMWQGGPFTAQIAQQQVNSKESGYHASREKDTKTE